MGQFKILGIAGSIRKQSYNKGVLDAAKELAPAGVSIDTFDLAGLPFYNQDDEANPTDRVKEFKAAIRAADAILIVTPEYNYSIPGVLKNAIDLASRPYGDSAWSGKPVAVMGATMGDLGTGRAQYHLRQVFVFLNMYALNQPEVMISATHEKFDANGKLTDEKAREMIGRQLAALVEWSKRLGVGK